MNPPRRSGSNGNGNGGDTCLYGSVVGMDALLRADTTGSGGDGATSPVVCDECEQQRARVECEDCGLAYCAPCDAYRHRKGKLLFHQRTPIQSSAGSSGAGHQSAVPLAVQPAQQPEQQEQGGSVLLWRMDQVSAWLRDHDLELFVAEITAHSVNGAFLLSSRMEEFLETHSSASRSHKKKLLREIQKLKAEQSDGNNSSVGSHSKTSMLSTPMKNVMMVSASVTELQSHTVQQQQQLQPNAARRLGMNLRVNVNTSPASAAPLSSSSTSSEPNFSPVTSLRSRIVHGQADELRGRINRRRSVLSPTSSSSSTPERSNSSSSLLSVNTADEPKRKGSNVLFGASQLRIDVTENALITSAVSTSAHEDNQRNQAPRLETRPSGRTDLRANRQALVGGLDLDIMQVKKEERSVEASFDFSAEGRLQTQGFEINVRYALFRAELG